MFVVFFKINKRQINVKQLKNMNSTCLQQKGKKEREGKRDDAVCVIW